MASLYEPKIPDASPMVEITQGVDTGVYDIKHRITGKTLTAQIFTDNRVKVSKKDDGFLFEEHKLRSWKDACDKMNEMLMKYSFACCYR